MPKNHPTIVSKAPASLPTTVRKINKKKDQTLGWVERDYPQLITWQKLAAEWIKGETRGIEHRLSALVAFLERYLVQQNLPLAPEVLLASGTVLPDFYQSACPSSEMGIKYNNHIHVFLQFVLLRDFSERNDGGELVISPAFRNPVPRLSDSGVRVKRDESVRGPLPYGYIAELRKLLAAGHFFNDWNWAHSAFGADSGSDWFEVAESLIDKADPDCVWRKRSRKGGERIEMWSPVRWVALLVKLIIPLRTFQVRMLDSGEMDTFQFTNGTWMSNPNPFAQGSQRHPRQQGVFRRAKPLADGEKVSTLLYINTNKTADIAKSGREKGYVMPWSVGGPINQDVFYWLEKLRNWQAKYNPVSRATAWTELDGRHTNAKSDLQLAGYPDTCFLFRMPEGGEGERHLPPTETTLLRPWFCLLEALELRLAGRGETHQNGAPIRFLPPPDEQNKGLTTLFPLHSLRVSLITALALEGQVPFPILQKLVGHSRLLMTLYYIKPGATRLHDALITAAEKLEATKEASIQNFLLDTEHEELLQRAICNSTTSIASVIPQHPAARNPAGWMPLHHGLCLVGGNTGEVEGNGSVGGCHNGGPNLGTDISPKYGAVPGGSRNCVRCRWFVTEPHHLPALAAHFNNLGYHFDEARNSCLTHELMLQDLKKQRADAEDAGQPFTQLDALRRAERVWESAMKRFSDLAEDLVACWRLIERCKAALGTPGNDGNQLVAVGATQDVQVVFEETESELLQLAGVCDGAEVYPDLEPGKAVFRRSQLLDAILYRERMQPMFMLLSEQEQLLAGNAFMRNLSQRMNPTNPVLGQREVISLMDAGVNLSQHFNMDLTSLLPKTKSGQAIARRPPVLAGRKV
jgi:hypothetical protein